MPPAALLIGGLAAGAIGSGLSQSAANKGPRPIFGGLNSEALGLLGGLGKNSAGSLESLIATGNPTDTSQVFATLAQQKKLQDAQGTAQIRERFGAQGSSFSSPAAVGESNYLAHSEADFMSTLAQYTFQAQEAAAGRQLAASEFGFQQFMGPAFALQGPKGSVAGAALGSASGGLESLGLLKALGFLG